MTETTGRTRRRPADRRQVRRARGRGGVVKGVRVVESSENLAGEVYSVVVGLPEGKAIKMGDELWIPEAGRVRVRRVRQPDAITAAASAGEERETILRLDVESG